MDEGRNTLRIGGLWKMGSIALKDKNFGSLQFFYDQPDTPGFPMQEWKVIEG